VADPSETTQVSVEPKDPEQTELLGAVRALSAQVGGLQAELRALRAESRSLPAPADVPAWDQSTPARREKSAWVRSLDRPGPRPPAVPRFLLEIVFLVAVAGAAAIAELEPVVIILLMAGAWALVATAEWFAARAARRQAEISAMPFAGAGGIFPDDPSWFAPPLERRPVDPGAEDSDVGEDTAHDEEPAASAPRLPPRAEQ
jgi:hypothetical protein